MGEILMTELVEGRVCGGCTMCCRALAIAPLGKPAGVVCGHVVEGGCGVYGKREAAEFVDCVRFECLWLRGWSGDADRPDKIGVVSMLKGDPDAPGEKRIQMAEGEMGAAEGARVQEMIGEILKGGMAVAITNREEVVTIRPTGERLRYEVDKRDGLRGRVDRGVAAVRLTVRGGRREED